MMPVDIRHNIPDGDGRQFRAFETRTISNPTFHAYSCTLVFPRPLVRTAERTHMSTSGKKASESVEDRMHSGFSAFAPETDIIAPLACDGFTQIETSYATRKEWSVFETSYIGL